jgi:hypothetical protein
MDNKCMQSGSRSSGSGSGSNNSGSNDSGSSSRVNGAINTAMGLQDMQHVLSSSSRGFSECA